MRIESPLSTTSIEGLVTIQTQVPGLFRDHPQPMVLYDLSGRIVVGNAAAIALLGHAPGTLVGLHFSAHLAPECVERAQANWEVAVGGQAADFEAVFVHADGHPVDVWATVTPARLGTQIVGVYGIVREVCREREIAAAMEQLDCLRSLYLIAASVGKSAAAQLNEILAVGSRQLAADEGMIMSFSDGYLVPTHTWGIPLAALAGLRLESAMVRRRFGSSDVVAIDDVDRPPWGLMKLPASWPWHSHIATPFMIAGEFAGILVFGSRSRRGALFSTGDREFMRLIGHTVGSTLERESEQQRLDELAFSDALTGLPNRALLAERLEELITESCRSGVSFAVHFLDLDGFKRVNDTAGHAVGDRVLREAARRLRGALPAKDSIARLGGDEFIVLQRDVRRPDDALGLADVLLDLMRIPFDADGVTHHLSASIGISTFPADGETGTSLLRHADLAVYRAKSSGRDRSVLFDSLNATWSAVRA